MTDDPGISNAELPLDIQRWYGSVYALCRSKLFSASDADDAAQETFLRGLEQFHRLKDKTAVGAWLRQIATYVCVDMMRRCSRRRHAALSDDGSVDPRGLDADRLEAAEEIEQIWRSIGELPEPLQECLLLHYFEHKSYDEIAEWLGVARSTVNERLSQARAQMRRKLMSSESRVP